MLYTGLCFAVLTTMVVWLLGTRTERDAINDLLDSGDAVDVPMFKDGSALVDTAKAHLYVCRK